MGYIYAAQLALTGHREVIGHGTDSFRAEIIPASQANGLIKAHHYSRKVARASYCHCGLFTGAALIGVLQFGPALNPASGTNLVPNVGVRDWCELNRMWLAEDAPAQSATRALRHAFAVLRARYPAIRFVQSFADERCGKNGAVYQAASFTYHGCHESVFWRLRGEWVHNIQMTRTTRLGKPERTSAAVRVQQYRDEAEKHVFRQFRYIRWFDRRARRACLLPELPYPKLMTRAG